MREGPGHLRPPLWSGSLSIDDSYRALTSSLPAHLQAAARGLPHRLGIGRGPDSGWEEFVTLHPNRDLPVYAAEARGGDGGLALPPEGVRLYEAAHHTGGFCWLLRDRLCDGQVAGDGVLLELAGVLGERWRGALAAATRDVPLVDELTAEVAVRWRRGTAQEREVLTAGAVTPGAYAAVVRDKLRWIGLPAQCLLLRGGGAAPARAFQRAHDLFLLALQAIDDVNDREEDRALYGNDVPRALGCEPGALLRVAPKLGTRAAAVAGAAGFSWFASWLSVFANAIDPWRAAGDPLADELGSIAIAGEMEEALETARGPGHSPG
jgi:hypothetical protein